MCFDTSVLIVSARLYSPFLKALNTKDTAWLTATSSRIAILRGNICTLRIMKAMTERTVALDHKWHTGDDLSFRSQGVKMKC